MLSNMTEQEFEQEKDMLYGNINRMCVSDDAKEILNMYNFACKRLERIYHYNYDRIHDQREQKPPEDNRFKEGHCEQCKFYFFYEGFYRCLFGASGPTEEDIEYYETYCWQSYRESKV